MEHCEVELHLLAKPMACRCFASLLRSSQKPLGQFPIVGSWQFEGILSTYWRSLHLSLPSNHLRQSSPWISGQPSVHFLVILGMHSDLGMAGVNKNFFFPSASHLPQLATPLKTSTS